LAATYHWIERPDRLRSPQPNQCLDLAQSTGK
jgi:hypothetical protein